jgi:hypothetical protein
MPSISEKDFDKLVHHTVRIDMTDNSVYQFPLLPEDKQQLIEQLRNLSFGMNEERTGTRLLVFNIYPGRMVFINTAYLLRLIFCFDPPHEDSAVGYRDNFKVLDEDEKTEDDYAKEKDKEGEEIFLPQAIIKLSKKVGYQESDVLCFSSISEGDLSGLDMEAENPADGLREFIELIDEDGENNFIPLKQIMCIEVDRNIVNEKDIEED